MAGGENRLPADPRAIWCQSPVVRALRADHTTCAEPFRHSGARHQSTPLDRAAPPWRCVAAGNGEVARFAALAEQAGLADRVTFTGWLAADAMHDCMRRADIVVLPSRTEALPLSLIEGACAGAALVATDVGNVRDIVEDGVNGILVAREPDAIADALRGLLDDPARLRAMQAASRDIYRARFTLTAFADRLRAVYLQTAGRPEPFPFR